MKTFSVWFESEEYFAERKIVAESAFMAVIKASVQLASEGGVSADLPNTANNIHVVEVEETKG